jgi:hypothetical protein
MQFSKQIKGAACRKKQAIEIMQTFIAGSVRGRERDQENQTQ